jgi:hypothetical protein
MDLARLAQRSAEDILRRALRLGAALQGAGWCLEVVRASARRRIESADISVTDDVAHRVPATEVAARLRISAQDAAAIVQAAGLRCADAMVLGMRDMRQCDLPREAHLPRESRQTQSPRDRSLSDSD